MYPEPDAFKPERFINADGSLRDDPVVTSAFGFGKRVCPGRHFVDSSFFIVVASLLSVFKIERGKGSDGGPDAYPFTGNGIRYSHRVSFFVWERVAYKTLIFFLSVVRHLFPALSSQEIKGRKNLSSLKACHVEPEGPTSHVCYFVLRFRYHESLCCCTLILSGKRLTLIGVSVILRSVGCIEVQSSTTQSQHLRQSSMVATTCCYFPGRGDALESST